MEKEILKKQKRLSKNGYIVVPNYFLREWIKMLGVGPAMLYLYLLTYCHKGKDIAWPTIFTLSKTMDLTSKTITKYRQTLVRYGLIKKISKRKITPGSHRRNIYRLSLFDMGKNTLSIGNIFPYLEVKFTPDIGENLPTNNNNLKHYQGNNNKEGKDTVVAVDFDFKKIKEKGEESMRVIKERLRDLDFEGKFIEQLLKDFSPKKIEEKLDLLIERRNIQRPAGWLVAALKNDYQDGQQEDIPLQDSSIPEGRGSIHRASNKETGQINLSPTKNISIPEQVSREKALEAIKLIQDNLSACISPLPSGKSTRVRENVVVQ